MTVEVRHQMNATEFGICAARQPLAYDLVDGVPVRRPDAEQAPARLRRLSGIAVLVIGDQAGADMWLSSPHSALGGLSPNDLAEHGEEGSQAALRVLIREHRWGPGGDG
jgi:hypothetical protein